MEKIISLFQGSGLVLQWQQGFNAEKINRTFIPK